MAHLTPGQVERIATALHEATCNGTTVAPPTDSHPSMDSDDGYAIQRRLVERLGSRHLGYKLGFTSAAMREQMGVQEPNFGLLLAQHETARVIPPGRFVHPRVEPEIALVTCATLRDTDCTLHETMAAVGSVHAALEIVDTRYHEYRFRAPDNIADNSSAAGFVLGPPLAPGQLDRLRLTGVLLSRNGQPVDHGVGANALGDPLAALQWLVQRLATEAAVLPAGSLVLTGGLTRAHSLEPGDVLQAEFGDGMGTVSAARAA